MEMDASNFALGVVLLQRVLQLGEGGKLHPYYCFSFEEI